ncbi:MAG: GrpB family protein [Bacteroidales bacterium]
MFCKLTVALEEVGYTHLGDLGIEGGEVFGYTEKEHLMEHNLYVCYENAIELKRHLTFCDYLRTHETERNRYSQTKLEMAKQYPNDMDSYVLGKQSIIIDIYEKCTLDISYKDKL